jgi:hypothetical protein
MLETTAAFDLAAFFAGPSTAFGIFEDRFGTVRRRFTVDMHGAFDRDGAFLLHEQFAYDDGERVERTWRIVPGKKGAFTATAPDVIGVVEGTATLDTVSMDYLHELRIEGRPVVMRFADRIHKLDDGSAFSRTRVSKWGIRIGEVSIFFQRGTAPRGDMAAAADHAAPRQAMA